MRTKVQTGVQFKLEKTAGEKLKRRSVDPILPRHPIPAFSCTTGTTPLPYKASIRDYESVEIYIYTHIQCRRRSIPMSHRWASPSSPNPNPPIPTTTIRRRSTTFPSPLSPPSPPPITSAAPNMLLRHLPLPHCRRLRPLAFRS